jgi:hypothetical protein
MAFAVTMRRRVFALAAVSCVAIASASRADTPPATVSIEYTAPANCPRSDTFAAELSARTSRARVVAPAPHVRALLVNIRAHKRGFAGRVIVRDPDGSETERAVAGESCGEVVAGLALIAAVAIDPLAATGAATPEPSGSVAPPSSSTPPAPPPPPPPTPPPAQTTEPPRETPPRATSNASQWNVAAGAQGGAAGGVAPDVLLVVPIFVEVAREGEIFSPAARIRVERTGTGTVAAGGAHAEFTWTAAELDLCPVIFGSRDVNVRPCARAVVGTLEASAVEVEPSRSGVRPWLSLGAALRGRIMVIGPLFLEAEGGATLAMVRDRFFVEPSQTVYRAPLVGWSATAGAGILFR